MLELKSWKPGLVINADSDHAIYATGDALRRHQVIFPAEFRTGERVLRP